MDIIHLLPDSVANQIAAGEVIQRPASVLKELVENSIDAGAQHIQILLTDAGRTSIQVIDDGAGMSETDARMAFERHATSKISDAADLYALHTMGFRGEALASIASVAQVELRTRRADDELGTLLEIAGSQVTRQEPVQCSVGTAFSVKNLFFNVPARRRFLKKNSTELNHLLTEFYRIALVNPQIAFTVVSDDEELFSLAQGTTKMRIENLFGALGKKGFSQQLLTMEAKTALISIQGYIGRPEFAQKNAQQYFFVNGRYMRHPYFHKAVMTAYSGLLQGENNPSYFIYFTITPDAIDINVHPTKTEIKFADEQLIWPILLAAVKETLGKFNVTPSIDFDQDGAVEMPVVTDPEKVRPPQTIFNPNYNPFGGGSTYKRQQIDWEQLYDGFEKKKHETVDAPIPASDNTFTAVQQNLSLPETNSDVFQFRNKYILTPVKSGLMIIDQQRAHFRILYEQYSHQMEKQTGVSQKLLFPEVVELSADDALLLEQLLPDLRLTGFDMEKFGKTAFSINGIPGDLTQVNITETINEVLFSTKNMVVDMQSSKQDTIAKTLAKSACLKSGQTLSPQEMNDVINRLFACSAHAVTPDGKPIVTIMTYEELEKRFK